MSRLTDALQSFEHQLRRVAPVAADALGPGISEAETVRRLASVGLPAPQDIREFFAWHSGSRRHDARWSSVPVGPGFWLADLDYLVQRYRQTIGFSEILGAEAASAQRGWLPLVITGSGDMVVAYCQRPSREPVPCSIAFNGDVMPTGEELHTLDLHETIEIWTTAILKGKWTCALDADGFPVWSVNRPQDAELSSLQHIGLIP